MFFLANLYLLILQRPDRVHLLDSHDPLLVNFLFEFSFAIYSDMQWEMYYSNNELIEWNILIQNLLYTIMEFWQNLISVLLFMISILQSNCTQSRCCVWAVLRNPNRELLKCDVSWCDCKHVFFETKLHSTHAAICITTHCDENQQREEEEAPLTPCTTSPCILFIFSIVDFNLCVTDATKSCWA